MHAILMIMLTCHETAAARQTKDAYMIHAKKQQLQDKPKLLTRLATPLASCCMIYQCCFT